MSARSMKHDWGEMDANRVQTCKRPGCGVQQTPSVGPLRSFGWRRSPAERWSIGMLPCTGTTTEGGK